MPPMRKHRGHVIVLDARAPPEGGSDRDGGTRNGKMKDGEMRDEGRGDEGRGNGLPRRFAPRNDRYRYVSACNQNDGAYKIVIARPDEAECKRAALNETTTFPWRNAPASASRTAPHPPLRGTCLAAARSGAALRRHRRLIHYRAPASQPQGKARVRVAALYRFSFPRPSSPVPRRVGFPWGKLAAAVPRKAAD